MKQLAVTFHKNWLLALEPPSFAEASLLNCCAAFSTLLLQLSPLSYLKIVYSANQKVTKLFPSLATNSWAITSCFRCEKLETQNWWARGGKNIWPKRIAELGPLQRKPSRGFWKDGELTNGTWTMQFKNAYTFSHNHLGSWVITIWKFDFMRCSFETIVENCNYRMSGPIF